MKVAYCMRVDAFDKPGGDLVQIQEYIRSGKKGRPDGEPLFEGEVVVDPNADLSRFDLIHLTNIDRPIDTYSALLSAQAARKPILISTIHHSYEEILRYEREGRGGLIGRVSGAVGFSTLEVFRSFIRCINYPQLFGPTIRAALKGLLKAQVSILKGSARILVLTRKEREDLVADFGIDSESPFACLRNGIQGSASARPAQRTFPPLWDVCVVARLEARKNQTAILKALNKLQLRGVFVGGENKRHGRFIKEFKELISHSESKYLGGVPYEQVNDLMRSAPVHVSASWFEVASLVDLEAALCGCCVVSSICGGTNEILGENAVYVDPGSEESIMAGISIALERAKNRACGDITANPLLPTWDEVAVELASIYQAVIKEGTAA